MTSGNQNRLFQGHAQLRLLRERNWSSASIWAALWVSDLVIPSCVFHCHPSSCLIRPRYGLERTVHYRVQSIGEKLCASGKIW